MSFASKIAVAPMMDWTDHHCRMFFRLISKNITLYTEMITEQALTRGKRYDLLEFDQVQHPIAVQLGGCNPKALAQCAQMAQDYGYDEVNLNVGCPSDRVQSGQFGVCLMKKPQLVAECVAEMRAVVTIPVTVKTRIGVDDQDDEAFLWAFIEQVSQAGCKHFIIHARKAWLHGLSPKENRTIPPLNYHRVYALKAAFPHLAIMLNGGITSASEVASHLKHVDAVMVGRAAYQQPYLLHILQQTFYQQSVSHQRHDLVAYFLPYIEACLHKGIRLHAITRHLLGLYHGQPKGKVWRRLLSTTACRPDADITILKEVLAEMADG